MADKARALYLLELSLEDWKNKEIKLTLPIQWGDYSYSLEEGAISQGKFDEWVFSSWLNIKESAIKELRYNV